MSNRTFTYLLIFSSIVFTSCTTSGPSGLFGKKAAHEEYGERLKSAGLAETALGKQWFQAAEQSLRSPLQVGLPYKETGYFSASQPRALGVRFNAKRGEKITVNVSKNPTAGFLLFFDMWQPTAEAGSPKLILSADTTQASIEYEIKKEGAYLVRLQPELLRSGDYTLTITNGPSLAFPVSAKVKSNIGSFWGANRDGGARKHEGIDIFGAMRTPLVAAADGIIGAVNETNIGGKVVWLRPEGKDYNLYYAHLDEQRVQPGQRVKAGEVIGLMGKTGNAKTTSPHLHFGIYAVGGAVDPFPFVNNNVKDPPKVVAPAVHLSKKVKTLKPATVTSSFEGSGEGRKIEANTLLTVEAASANKYKVLLPDGSTGFINSGLVGEIAKPIRKNKVSSALAMLDAPQSNAPKKSILSAGDEVTVLAAFGEFLYVQNKQNEQGWLPKNAL